MGPLCGRRDLAEKVSALTGTPIAFLDNPRKEAEDNDLCVRNDTLMRLGLAPIKLDDRLLSEITEIAQRYRQRIDTAKIPCVSRW